MRGIKVSIVVPFFNVAPYIERCMESLSSQTHDNIEILCVDDCSEDDSIELVNQWARLDERVKLFRHETNKGLGGARNTGILNASGDYVCFVDSDDYVAPRFVEVLLDAINSERAQLAACGFTMFEGADVPIASVMPTRGPLTVERDKRNIFQIAQSVRPASWLKIYLREMLVKNRISQPENRYYEGVRFWLECISQTDCIATVQQALYFYRIRPGSIMTTISFKHIDDRIAYIRDIDLFVRNRIMPNAGEHRDQVWRESRAFLVGHVAYGNALIDKSDPAGQAIYRAYYNEAICKLAEELSCPGLLGAH
jgi:glycosyltransferase involved in cell wall biosynthesis